MSMGQNPWLHFGSEHPCTTYFDVHQGFLGFDPRPNGAIQEVKIFRTQGLGCAKATPCHLWGSSNRPAWANSNRTWAGLLALLGLRESPVFAAGTHLRG